MIYGIAIDAFYGIRQKRAYECDYEGRGFFPIPDNATAKYVKGETAANYPMPAIRTEIEYFPDRVILWEKLNYWKMHYLYLYPFRTYR